MAANIDNAVQSHSQPVPNSGGDDLTMKKRLFTAFKSFLAGTCAGITGKIIEYPFDTVKVRLQTQNFVKSSSDAVQFNGALDCLRKTVANEGFAGLYKGLLSPLIGAAGENMMSFVLFDQVKMHYINATNSTAGTVPMRYIFFAGGVAGFGTTLVLTPVELVKCRLQIQQSSAEAAYSGVMDCAKTVFKEEGIRGLFRGGLSTMAREVPGNALWFGTYETLIRSMLRDNQSREEVGTMKTILAGGCAGGMYWLVPYPFDSIKSYMVCEKCAPPLLNAAAAAAAAAAALFYLLSHCCLLSPALLDV